MKRTKMDNRDNITRRGNIRFSGKDITLAVKMVEKLSPTIDIVYYLMNRGDERSFVMMLISAQEIALEALLEKDKRDTDILFEIDKEASLYALICQDTKIDGGYHFAKRLLQSIETQGAKEIYCTDLEIRTTNHEIKFVIFKLIETYMKSKEEGRSNEIVFKSLN